MMGSRLIPCNSLSKPPLGIADEPKEKSLHLTNCEDESSDTCDSDDSEKCLGFAKPNLNKFVTFMNLIRKKESIILGKDLEKRDVINGIVFLSFKTEEGLLNYAKQDIKSKAAGASQSDDGLEIQDDGSSDTSSSHTIVPTKTTDIKKIKGWRTKNFANVNLGDDSGSSVRNDDDGFGDDLEMKSIQGESSDENESVDSVDPTTVSSGFGGRFVVDQPSGGVSLESQPERNGVNKTGCSAVEETSAVRSSEESIYRYRKSDRESLESLTNSRSSRPSTAINSTSTLDTPVGIFTLDKISPPSGNVQMPAVTKSIESTNSLGKKSVYKPRLKSSFLENLASKVNSSNDDKSFNTPSKIASSSNEGNKFRWRVPKEKLIAGNIYDLEVSPSNCTDSEFTMQPPNNTSKPDTEGESWPTNLGEFNYNGLKHEVINIDDTFIPSAFESRSLDQFTTNLGELHIDFQVPKLDASETVTHYEIDMPKAKVITPSKPKPKHFIKAKTVAERRRLLEEMVKCQKRKRKLTYKLRDEDSDSSSSSKESVKIRNAKKKQKINKEKTSANIKKSLKKPILTSVSCFDNQGVITYGKEKPLLSIFNKNKLLLTKNQLFLNKKNYDSKRMCMIFNVGFKRPLYKETADNLNTILNNDCEISKECAEFAVAALQKSVNGPFKVTRFLVPVNDTNLKDLLYSSAYTMNQETKLNKCKRKLPKPDCKLDMLTFDDKTVGKESLNVDTVISNVVRDIICHIERKESLDNLNFAYDPDVPMPVEKETPFLETDIQKLKINQKQKRSKVQIQVEKLGGTFINAQSDIYENVLRPLEGGRCTKEHCQMGCVCVLEPHKSEHCSKESCMFTCICSPSSKKQGCEIKNKIWLLPDVLRIKNLSQSKLAKVEREYHQTVIMTNDKQTIMMENKRSKRERKVPSKFKDDLLLGYQNEDDFEIITTPQRQTSKNSHQTQSLTNAKVVSTNSVIVSLDSFLGSPSKIDKSCFVRIEKDEVINKIAAKKPVVPGLFCSNIKRKKSVVKSIQPKARNVARKKTGGSTSHCFDVKNHCSRTYGIFLDYVQRNLMRKLKTKNMILYADKPHSVGFSKNTSLFHPQHGNDFVTIKEDLEFESSPSDELHNDEMACDTDKEYTEEGCGLAIGFVCSLRKEDFENQGSEYLEGNSDSLKSAQVKDAMEDSEKEIVTENSYQKDVSDSKKKKERIVYASLPATETKSKWWVVEMDKDKFTDLSYFTDRRRLAFNLMNNANIMAEHNKSTVFIALHKPFNNLSGKFGAYSVPGHKNLIFFGPYDLEEIHGLTAVKLTGGKFSIVPFTTNFRNSEVFKSLGIFSSEDEDSLKADGCDESVKAVWWYSTVKAPSGTTDLNTNADVNLLNEEIIESPLVSKHLENQAENIDDTNEFQETTLVRSAETCLENEFSYPSSNSPNDSCNETRMDFNENPIVDSETRHDDQEMKPSFKSDEYEEDITVIDDASPVDMEGCTNSLDMLMDDIAFQASPSDRQNSPVSFEEATALITKVQKVTREVIIEREKDITSKMRVNNTKSSLSKRKLFDDSRFTEFKHNPAILRLKEKIAGLSNEIDLAKVNSGENWNCQLKRLKNMKKLPDFLSDSEDSSSGSDEAFYEEIGLGQDSTKKMLNGPTPFVFPGNSDVDRVIHKPSATRSLQSKEEKPGPLPPGLLLAKPQEGQHPERALLCLTKGVGYIPVMEFDRKKLVIADPESDKAIHQFTNLSHAEEWLNELFSERFTVKTNLKWILVKGSIISRLTPLAREVFQFPPKQVEVSKEGISSPISLKQELRNQLERERRQEISKLYHELSLEVLAPYKLAADFKSPSNITVLKSAKNMIDTQRQIALELSSKSLKLTEKKSELSSQLRNLFASLRREERVKAIQLCKSIKNSMSNQARVEEADLSVMKKLEIKRANKKPGGAAPGTDVETITIKKKNVKNSTVPKEGILVRKKQSSNVAESTSSTQTDLDLTLPSDAAATDDVINLVDSDEDKGGAIIEIISDNDEEDVIWLQDGNSDNDIEILSSNIKRKPRVPKRKKQRAHPRGLPLKKGKTGKPQVDEESDAKTWALYLQQKSEINSRSLNCENSVEPRVESPELEVVEDSEDKTISGCSRTDPVPGDIQLAALDRFLPISASGRVNITGLNTARTARSSQFFHSDLKSSSGFRSCFHKKIIPNKSKYVKKSLLKPSVNQGKMLPNSISDSKKALACKNIQPIGKIDASKRFNKALGKPILLSITESGCKLSKLPSTSLPLNSTPLTVTTTSAGNAPLEKEKTVTLHHPLEKICEARTVKFASLGAVRLEQPSTSTHVRQEPSLSPNLIHSSLSNFRVGHPALNTSTASQDRLSPVTSYQRSHSPILIRPSLSNVMAGQPTLPTVIANSDRVSTVTSYQPRIHSHIFIRPPLSNVRMGHPTLPTVIPGTERVSAVTSYQPTSHSHILIRSPLSNVRAAQPTSPTVSASTDRVITSHSHILIRPPVSNVRAVHPALPTVTSSHDRASPVTVNRLAQPDAFRNMRRDLPSTSQNTVTLYHPSEEVCVTQTVNFGGLSSGPKIRKPKDDSPNIKVILPKKL